MRDRLSERLRRAGLWVPPRMQFGSGWQGAGRSCDDCCDPDADGIDCASVACVEQNEGAGDRVPKMIQVSFPAAEAAGPCFGDGIAYSSARLCCNSIDDEDYVLDFYVSRPGPRWSMLNDHCRWRFVGSHDDGTCCPPTLQCGVFHGCSWHPIVDLTFGAGPDYIGGGNTPAGTPWYAVWHVHLITYQQNFSGTSPSVPRAGFGFYTEPIYLFDHPAGGLPDIEPTLNCMLASAVTLKRPRDLTWAITNVPVPEEGGGIGQFDNFQCDGNGVGHGWDFDTGADTCTIQAV